MDTDTNIDTNNDTTAIVLAGGRGSRMNYQEKAWLNHQGKPLITHVIEKIRPQVTDILISRNRLDPRYEELPFICIPDANKNFEGPLAGVSACLSLIETPYTLVVPCDTPNLPAKLASQLKQHLGKDDVCIATDEERDQPLIMLARTKILAGIAGYLEHGGRSVHGWLKEQQTARACFPGSQLHNINEASQLE